MAKDEDSLSSDVIAKFDSMMSTVLEKMGIKESADDIISQCGSIRLRIFEAGEYERKDKPGEKVKFEAGVELRQGGLVLHVEPSDLALLVYNMKNDPKVNSKLSERLQKEQEIMKSLGFH